MKCLPWHGSVAEHHRQVIPALFACFILGATTTMGGSPAKLEQVVPEDVGMRADVLEQIDDVVAASLAAKRMPGCVVLVARRGKVVLKRAYGHKRVEPDCEPMTVDTVFDMASITKPVVTATSIMILVEQGKLRLRDRVSQHIPEFGQNGKETITVQQLLLHQGGLIPDNAVADYDSGPDEAWQKIYALSLVVEPGTTFKYTDVGYLVLGELVHRISGLDVHAFSQRHIFDPLGMEETGYLPKAALRQRAAPTEQREGHWMQGEVHDPRSYRLGGVAGHAGLFSTADDLAVYAQMMLGRGRYQRVRILGEATVAQMTRRHAVSSGFRGLGWDMETGYSSNRSELASPAAFGHGGFTGTGIWIDPPSDLIVIFLSNRVHPDGKGSVNPLIGAIGTVATAAIDRSLDVRMPHTWRPADATLGARFRSGDDGQVPQVRTGIDVLIRLAFAPLAGRRVGLITNHTGQDRRGIPTAQLFRNAAEVKLVALFSPEHGISGQLDTAKIGDTRNAELDVPVTSLYGETRRPTAASLKGIDTLVFDIQDIGARFYTYISTMGLAMEAAADHGLAFVVLDRPNPIGGAIVAGPVRDADRESFIGFHPIPVRHGMTAGELARLIRQERKLTLDLTVIPVEGWRRDRLYDATGLLWINPSPNMRSLSEALLYPGIGLLETTNLSVGRGTDTPFELVGAPWIDPSELARSLNRAPLSGVCFVPVRFTPASSKYQGERCGGVNVILTDRRTFRPVRCGLEIAHQLRKLYPEEWHVASMDRILMHREVLTAIEAGKTVAELEAIDRPRLEEFLQRREKFLLYE
ncbi:MAG: exo-beta-N-acetylmuramidase NamZ domain-containing protein [Pirellulales bacterium]